VFGFYNPKKISISDFIIRINEKHIFSPKI